MCVAAAPFVHTCVLVCGRRPLCSHTRMPPLLTRVYGQDVLNFCTQCDQSNAQTAKVVLAGFLWGTLVIFLLATFWSCVRPRKSLSVDTEQEELRLARLRENKGLLKKAITKFKILVSFFHIIGPLESSLKVRFPVIFSQFLRFMYALSSFDTLSVRKTRDEQRATSDGLLVLRKRRRDEQLRLRTCDRLKTLFSSACAQTTGLERAMRAKQAQNALFASESR